MDATTEQLRSALDSVAGDDPSFSFTSLDSGEEVTLYGMGELHLEIIRERLLREHNIQVEAGEPRVVLLETIRKVAEGEARFIRQSGPRGQYAHVRLRVENNSGGGYAFVNEIKNGAVPSQYIAAVNEGIKEALKGGVLVGSEMIDVKSVLCGGSYHEADSSEMAFKIAASMALKEAARKASPVLLEPVMSVDVVVPEEFMGTIIEDLNSRRGRIESMKRAPA